MDVAFLWTILYSRWLTHYAGLLCNHFSKIFFHSFHNRQSDLFAYVAVFKYYRKIHHQQGKNVRFLLALPGVENNSGLLFYWPLPRGWERQCHWLSVLVSVPTPPAFTIQQLWLKWGCRKQRYAIWGSRIGRLSTFLCFHWRIKTIIGRGRSWRGGVIFILTQ